MQEWLRRRWTIIWRLIGGVSLRIKIVGITLVMTVLLGLGLAWQVRVAMARTLAEGLEQRGVSVAYSLAIHSASGMSSGDLYDLSGLARDTVLDNKDVEYVFVLDSQGEILAHSFSGGLPAGLLMANSVLPNQRYRLKTLQTEGGLVQDVAVPILDGHSGTVRVGMSHRRLNHTVAGITRQILLTTLLVSLLGIVVSTSLTVLFTRPLLALAKATRRILEEGPGQRLAPWADDEVGQLQASFNAMVDHLAHSNQAMEDYNRQLLRRNQELSALNAIASAVAGPLGLIEVLERALQQTIRVVNAAGGWICLLEEGNCCQVFVGAGNIPPADVGVAYCQRCPVCSDAVQTRQPLVVNPLAPQCRLRVAKDAVEHAIACHVAVPLLVKERTVGLLNLAYGERSCIGFETEDFDLLTAIGRQLGVAIENARLWEELWHKEALRGQLLRKIITAQEDERQRIARELHDEAGQALTSLLVGLRAIEKSDSLREVHTLTVDLRKVVAQTLDEVHNLALELRPSVLDDLGLVPALSRYVQSCPTRFGFQADFVASGMDDHRLPQEVETTLYRITQEALTNVARHASASYVSVLLQRRGGAVVLVVEDDGDGFEMAQVMASSEKRERIGLYGVEERALLVGGRLAVESKPGAGATISVEIPLGDI